MIASSCAGPIVVAVVAAITRLASPGPTSSEARGARTHLAHNRARLRVALASIARIGGYELNWH